MNDTDRYRILEDAMTWSDTITCDPEKIRYAFRVWDMFKDLNMDVPINIKSALIDLLSCKNEAEPCRTVNNYLKTLMNNSQQESL
jgi:hypothetical protein